MDKIKHVRQSRAEYRSHVMLTLKKVDKILEEDNPFSDLDIVKLTSHMKQLTQKKYNSETHK